MMHGQPLSATLPEDFGLGDRFWYWRGASGQRYIHSIYRPDVCPPVPGAIFVLVSTATGRRQALGVGRFNAEGTLTGTGFAGWLRPEDEIHVHLLSRGDEAARLVLRDLEAAMGVSPAQVPESRPYVKPVQLDLLAA